MMSRLLEQRWPVTATLSDPEVTHRGKHYLDLKSDQWTLLEELEQVLKPFEQATVFLSGEAYADLIQMALVLIIPIRKKVEVKVEVTQITVILL